MKTRSQVKRPLDPVPPADDPLDALDDPTRPGLAAHAATSVPNVGAPVDDVAVLPTSTVLQAPAPAVPPPKGSVSPEIQRIIESVFDVRLDDTWKRLLAFVRQHETPGAYNVRAMLREVEDRCREAHKLYCVLKADLERYKSDNEATRAAMRSEASDALEDEKAQGLRKKSITEGDIRARMIEMHPDEFAAVERGERRFSLAVEHAAELVGILKQKSRSLNTEARGGVSSGADD